MSKNSSSEAARNPAFKKCSPFGPFGLWARASDAAQPTGVEKKKTRSIVQIAERVFKIVVQFHLLLPVKMLTAINIHHTGVLP